MLFSSVSFDDISLPIKRKYDGELGNGEKSRKIEEGKLLHEQLRDDNDVKLSENSSKLIHQNQTKSNSLGPFSPVDSDDESDIDLFADSPSFDHSDENTNDNTTIIETESNDWDDKDGRLKYRIGEVLADKYRVIGYFGKGTFGNVLRVQDINNEDKFFAVKVARSHHEMNSAFNIEKEVLEKLGKIEKSFCVQLIDSFEFHKHNCLVLESMKECGRDLISRLGGVSLQACKIYGNQLLRALHYVHSIGAIHADVKPDNVLIGENEAVVRLCDFGTALFDYQVNFITAEYGSLYYRAPEIILGYDVSTQVDVWSLACCLIELFTGEILFRGKSNNHMLELFMQLLGKFPKKIIKKSSFGKSHFDVDNMKFHKEVYDNVTGKLIVSQKTIPQRPQVNLYQDFLAPVVRNTSESKHSLLQFADVLMQMLCLDPKKRLTPAQALQHPFFKG